MNNQLKKKSEKEFSEEDGNMEIVSQQNSPLMELSSQNDAVILNKDGLNLKKGGNVIIGKLNLIVNPFRKRYEKHYKNSKFHLVADIILALAVLVMVALIIWAAFLRIDRNVFLNLTADEKIKSGESATFEIAYGNKNKEDISDSNITINFPKNFIIENVTPQNNFDDRTNTFRIGTLAGGANGKIKITGIPFGEVGASQTIAAAFNYKKYGKQFNILNSLIYPLEGSALELNLSIPKELYQEVEFEGSLTLKNNSSKDLSNIDLSFDKTGFEIIKTKSEFELKNNILRVSKLKAGEEMTIDFTAITRGGEGISKAVISSYLIIAGERFKQEILNQEINIKIPKFKVSAIGDKNFMAAGDEIIFSVIYKNEEQEKINNIRLEIASGNKNFSLGNLVLVNPGKFKLATSTSGGVGFFTASDINAGDEGKIIFKVKPERNNIETEDKFYVDIKINYRIGDNNIQNFVKSVGIKVLSNLNVKSAGYYYSPQGDQLGIGPLPPVVGIPTDYWVFWEVENLGNDLKNLTVTAQLPEKVIWTGSKNLLAGDLQYSPMERKITWVVDAIDKRDGKYRAGFEIGITPQPEDEGNILNLLESVKYGAYDNFCEEEISGNLKNITTNIEYDKLANGKGRVVN